MSHNGPQPDNTASGINDLTVASNQQSPIKGGPAYQSQGDIAFKSNAATQDNILSDLEPTGEVKGGPGGYNCSVCGIGLGNHNETTADDEEAEIEALDDLPAPVNALPDLEPEDEVVGGALKGKPQHLVDSWTQHNETMAEDEDDPKALTDLPVENAEQVTGGLLTGVYYVGNANGGVWK
jgi:hypothetical protein